jgi:hypothetical protein
MIPTDEEIQQAFAENKLAIMRAKQAEERFLRIVKRSERRTEETRERLRRAGILRDSA